MKKSKQEDVTVSLTEELDALEENVVLPIIPGKSLFSMTGEAVYYSGRDGISLYFRDRNKKSAINEPYGVRVFREGTADSKDGKEPQSNYRLCFLFEPGKAPRGNGGEINTSIFDRHSFIIQTGVNEKKEALGKSFNELVCVGFSYDTKATEKKMEMITCLTNVLANWNSIKIERKLLPSFFS